MGLDPRMFRGMGAAQIAFVLAIDEAVERQGHAATIGAKCSKCLDTGMLSGRFCGCEAGGKLGVQGFANPTEGG